MRGGGVNNNKIKAHHLLQWNEQLYFKALKYQAYGRKIGDKVNDFYRTNAQSMAIGIIRKKMKLGKL